ncbi:MAG: CAP domain-containing protein [Leptospiraceae bacterium]
MRILSICSLIPLVLILQCQGPEIQKKRVSVDPETGETHHSEIEIDNNSDSQENNQPTLTSQEKEFVRLVNEHRKKVGCQALILNPVLQRIAVEHSRDMAARDFFSHTNPDGESPFDRMKAAGLRYSWAAENIAFGQRSASEVFKSWLDSSGHRKNIENCRLSEHGIGHYSVTNHWTHVFATFR